MTNPNQSSPHGRKCDYAILFWFYKDVEVCVNRLSHLRRLNPHTPIYGLYGGTPDHARDFEEALPWLDDFWAYPEIMPKGWAWRNGDLLIRKWYIANGQKLSWDTVFVAQWDLLVTKPLSSLLCLERDDFLISGLRPVREVESWWGWVRGDQRLQYDAFLEHVQADHGFDGDPLCGLFIVSCLPRSFLDRFAALERPGLGFLEYKLPTYASVFGNRLVDDRRFRPLWLLDPSARNAPVSERLLNASRHPIHLKTVLANPDRGVYHPYRGLFPVDARSPM